jgi:STE24 endopeptidase
MRASLLWCLVVILLIAPSGVAAADSFSPDAGTVVIDEDPGQRDTVTFYIPTDTEDPKSVARTTVQEAGIPVRDLQVNDEERTVSYTPISVTTTIGERTTLLGRSIDGGLLADLSVLKNSRLILKLPETARVTRLGDPIAQDSGDTVYPVDGGRDVRYHLPVQQLGVLCGIILGATLLPFAGVRWYGRRVMRSDGDTETKVHRLRLATTIGIFPLVLVLAPVLFEAGVAPTAMFVVSGLVPGVTSNEIVGLFVIMGSTMGPMALSFIAVVLGVFPYDKQLRDTTIDARSAVKKSLAGLALMFIPLIGWFLLVTQLPSSIFESNLVIVGLLAVFLGTIMALQPYLIMLLQNTRELDGPLRDRIDTFCAEQGRSLRNVYRIDGQGNKLANALVAGTIPGLNYVFITDHLIAEFPDEEIEAIVAHELGHLEHRHLWYQGGLSLLVFGGWILSADYFGFENLMDQFGFYGTFIPIIALMLVYLVVLRGWLAVRQEYEADIYAASLTGPTTAVRALRRLSDVNYQQKNTGWLYNRLTFHPSIVDRVEHIQSTIHGVSETDSDGDQI